MLFWGFEMQQVFDALFDRYGARFTVAGNVVRGFFSSINSRSWQNMEQSFGPLGEIPKGQYICMLPVAVAAATGDTVMVGQKSYQIRRVEDMQVGDATVYRWCMCVEKGGEDLW